MSCHKDIIMKDKIKPGSPFLFSIIRLLIFVFSLTAVALLGMSIWFIVKLNSFSWVEIAFMGFSLFELALVLLGCTAKQSKIKLKCFMYAIGLLFLIQFTVAIVVFAKGESIIDDVIDATHAEQQRQILIDELKDYMFYVNAVIIATIAIEGVIVVFTKCYIGSLKDNNNEYDYHHVDEQGNRMTVNQKNMTDKQRIEEKYTQKREEMRQKYGKN